MYTLSLCTVSIIDNWTDDRLCFKLRDCMCCPWFLSISYERNGSKWPKFAFKWIGVIPSKLQRFRISTITQYRTSSIWNEYKILKGLCCPRDRICWSYSMDVLCPFSRQLRIANLRILTLFQRFSIFTSVRLACFIIYSFESVMWIECLVEISNSSQYTSVCSTIVPTPRPGPKKWKS